MFLHQNGWATPGDPGRGRTTLWRGAREALAEEHAALVSQRVGKTNNNEELYPLVN